MNIFDFVTQEEIDDLPHDDPQATFVRFVRIAQRRPGERTAQICPSDESGWEELNEARHGLMNVVIAAAKKIMKSNHSRRYRSIRSQVSSRRFD